MKLFKNNIGYFAMLMAVIGFGSGPPFVTLALREFFIIDLLALRFLISFFLILIFGMIVRADLSIKKVGLKPFLMGLLNPFLVTLAFHIGLMLTSPINGVAIISTMPLMQPFVARFFLGEKIELKVIIGAFITIIGTYILLKSQTESGNGNYLGDLIIFLGMTCASINEVIGRKVMQTKVDQIAVNTYQYFTGFILSFLILFIIWPNSTFNYSFHLDFTPSVIAAITLSFITFASYLFYNYALRRVPVGRISLMYPLTGPIGALSAWLVIDAEITFKIFISLGIILIGTITPYLNQKN
jgi:drug/metabolite transporter (DMT)-like permease